MKDYRLTVNDADLGVISADGCPYALKTTNGFVAFSRGEAASAVFLCLREVYREKESLEGLMHTKH